MSKYSVDDQYIDPGSGVLKNKLGLTDEILLAQVEADYVALRAVELAEAPITGPINAQALQLIHKRLFGDVYEWAGVYRNVDISKGGTRFANVHHIGSSLQQLFTQLQSEKELIGLTATDFSRRAAYYMGELNAIHPFREGNGRTQRELLSQLAYRTGLLIDWHSMGSDEILAATISSYRREFVALEN